MAGVQSWSNALLHGRAAACACTALKPHVSPLPAADAPWTRQHATAAMSSSRSLGGERWRMVAAWAVCVALLWRARQVQAWPTAAWLRGSPHRRRCASMNNDSGNARRARAQNANGSAEVLSGQRTSAAPPPLTVTAYLRKPTCARHPGSAHNLSCTAACLTREGYSSLSRLARLVSAYLQNLANIYLRPDCHHTRTLSLGIHTWTFAGETLWRGVPPHFDRRAVRCTPPPQPGARCSCQNNSPPTAPIVDRGINTAEAGRGPLVGIGAQIARPQRLKETQARGAGARTSASP